MPSINDTAARGNHYLTGESDWIDFETIVSTSADQIALAPGYLQREWTDGGRRYFHYKMDAPILGFVAWLSADWEVARDRWNDVAIEIYRHRAHPYNVDRMIDAVKKSFDCLTGEFSPYQHRPVRIVEFPRYARFAQSLPNTIPFSESIGFIAKLDEDDEEAIDYVFYVTAHEVAHQWWAHQVIGSRRFPCRDSGRGIAEVPRRRPGRPDGKLLALEKRKIDATETAFEIVVTEEPRRAGIDPFTKLIDRNPDNNVSSVRAGDGS